MLNIILECNKIKKGFHIFIVFILIISICGCTKEKVNNESKSNPKEDIVKETEKNCIEKAKNDDFSCYTGEYKNYFNDSTKTFDNDYFIGLKNERTISFNEDESICFTNKEYPLPGYEYQVCIYPIGTPLKIFVCSSRDGDQSIVENGYITEDDNIRVYWQTSSGCDDFRETLYIKKQD